MYKTIPPPPHGFIKLKKNYRKINPRFTTPVICLGTMGSIKKNERKPSYDPGKNLGVTLVLTNNKSVRVYNH
jgi:hypothetical protein